MTGFARGHGVCGGYSWAWELKSVNAKGLDLRLRLPVGWDAVESPLRASANSCAGNRVRYVDRNRRGVAAVARINEPVLAAVLVTLKNLTERLDAAPTTARWHSFAQGSARNRRARPA